MCLPEFGICYTLVSKCAYTPLFYFVYYYFCHTCFSVQVSVCTCFHILVNRCDINFKEVLYFVCLFEQL